jgi:V/A-type H+-transporting ATPase subunit E
MALEGILEKIAKGAEQNASAIREEARLKRQEILAEAESLARQASERILREAKEKAELETRRASVSAALERRREVLKKKQELIEECFQAALDELVNLPQEEYRTLVRTMLLHLVSTGQEVLSVSPNDEKRLGDDFIATINDDLRKMNKNGDLKVQADSPAIRGGFILRTVDVEVDCSFGTLLAQLREEVQSDVAKILFGDAK